MLRALLKPHPGSASAAVRGIGVFLSRGGAGVLTAAYALDGDLERLLMPPWSGVHAGERLWEHTCFEMFVARPGAAAYHELNFSPSGAWAAYAFEDYRKNAPLDAAAIAPQIRLRRGERTLELEASIALARLSPDYAQAPLALGISAVVEDGAAGLSYWALAHPGAKPDFHCRDGFVLKLDPGSSPG